MMKKSKSSAWNRGALCALTFVLCAILFFKAGEAKGAINAEPGSAGDPLITKSYLDERLMGAMGGFCAVRLTKSEKLTVAAGGEFVVYSGNATVVGAEGVVNLTNGELFAKGNSAIRYHLYLSPADTSGIRADKDCIVYVSGAYTVGK